MESLFPSFFQPPEGSFFLFGPRGPGKSTFLKQRCEDALWVDLLKPDVFRLYAARLERIIELVEGSPEKAIISINFEKLTVLFLFKSNFL